MKKLSSAFLSLALCASLYADSYIGVSYGTATSDPIVAGNTTGDAWGPYNIYDDQTFTGLSMNFFNTTNKDTLFSYGLGFDFYANDGELIDGGLLDANIKLGVTSFGFKLYGLVGVGIQSLSDYTVAVGAVYGAGLRYDILKHLSASVEYRNYALETTDNDEYTANQSYDLTGAFVSIDYKF